ncbi:TolC family protein [Candidatus Neomarinimicrobiota bacterium]
MKTLISITLILGYLNITFAQESTALTLEQLLEIGLENNSDVLVAERSLSAARAQKRGSYSRLVPSLRTSLRQNLNPEPYEGQSGESYDPRPYSSGYSVDQTLFDGGASWYNARSGAIAYESAEAGFEGTRLQTLMNIKEAYYNLLKTQELLDVAKEALDLSRKQLELVEERFRLQAVKQTDLLKARVNTGQREAEVHQAQQNVQTATTSLQLVLGQDPGRPLQVARDVTEPKTIPDHEVALQAMLKENPGIRAQALAVESAWLNAKMQRGVLLPSASLSYSVNSSGVEKMGDLYQDSQSATFLNFSVPIFTGMRNTSMYSRMRYTALAEEERYEGYRRDFKRQLENTLSSLASLHKIYPVNQEVLASAEADVRLANEQYNLGAIAILDLLDAQVSLISARSTLVRTTYDIKISEARLEALMGIGTE